MRYFGFFVCLFYQGFLLFIYQNTHKHFWPSHFQAVKHIVVQGLERGALYSTQCLSRLSVTDAPARNDKHGKIKLNCFFVGNFMFKAKTVGLPFSLKLQQEVQFIAFGHCEVHIPSYKDKCRLCSISFPKLTPFALKLFSYCKYFVCQLKSQSTGIDTIPMSTWNLKMFYHKGMFGKYHTYCMDIS